MLRLFLLSLSFVLSLLIFQSGFLLKREELHINSTCLDANVNHSECWLPKQHGKVFLLIVDALRFDFLKPTTAGVSEKHYQGQMKNVQRLLDMGGAIASVISDPPTTTLQRIKAITTGTLPTFIEAGSNFSPDAPIMEDNFIAQAKSLNRRVFFCGDDTWVSLFPNAFTKARGFPSFNINDLYSVDDNVRALVKTQLDSNEEMDLIIAHVLGVDHCGHKHGPSHAEMGNVLRKTDRFISEIASKLHDDDLLIVMGDHGMTATGDHGGDSFDETHAGIFVYSPGRHIYLRETPYQQIDIVPTISLLLGLPIPYSNLGTVISELFDPSLRETVVNLNYDQLLRFANTYASSNYFGELFDAISREGSSAEEQLAIMSRIQSVLRSSWTQFDWPLMRSGLFSFVEAFFFSLSGRELTNPTIVVRTGCLFLQFAILSAGAENNAAVPLLLVSLLISIVYSIVYSLLRLFPYQYSVLETFLFLVCVGYPITFLSNSYIVYEGHVTRFLLQSVVLFIFIDKCSSLNKYTVKSLMTSKETLCTMTALIILRCEPFFHRCREEEINCTSYFPSELSGSLTSDMQIVRLFLSIISQICLNFWLYRKFVNPSIPSSLRLAWTMSRPALFFTVLHHMSTISLGSNTKYGHISLILAQVVYACSALSFFLSLNARSKFNSSLICIVYALCWSFFLILGDGLTIALILFIVLIGAIFQVCSEKNLPLVCTLLISFGFYFVGHSPTLSAIPWQAAFVGLPGNIQIQLLPAILVITHICVVIPVVIFALPIHPTFSKYSIFTLLSMSSVRVLFVCMSATIHRRHLMVWKIFAPKFIFESVTFIYILILLSFVLALFRVHERLKV